MPGPDKGGICFHKVVRDVPASKVEQNISSWLDPLKSKTWKKNYSRFSSDDLSKVMFCFSARKSEYIQHQPTCGGGRPPAPSGHTGSMVSFLDVLHWHSGEGLRGLHFGLSSISIKEGLTIGISHSVVMLLHGKSLRWDEIEPFCEPTYSGKKHKTHP